MHREGRQIRLEKNGGAKECKELDEFDR